MARIEYGKIIRRSWEISIKHKWLWILGFLVGTGGGGGGSNISRIGDLGGENENIFKEGIPTDLPDKTREVLGATTDALVNWLQSVSPLVWLGLGAGLVLAIVLGIILSLVLRSWAKGSLIQGLKMAESGKDVNLKTVSIRKWDLIKHLILLGVINSLILVGVMVATGVVALVGTGIFSLVDAILPLWYAVAGVIGVIWIVTLLLLSAMIGVYAERLIVFDGITPWIAWKKGLALSRGNFLPTVVMGVINNGVGCLLGCGGMVAIMTVLGIPFGIIAATSFRNGFTAASGVGAVMLVIIGLIFINSFALLTGFLSVFRYSNWNLFYEEITKGEKI